MIYKKLTDKSNIEINHPFIEKIMNQILDNLYNDFYFFEIG